MTQIFFYHGAADRIAAAAGLIAKAWAQRKPLLVYAPDPAVAGALDRALWVRNPIDFVPHVGAGSPLAGETPVIIAGTLDQLPQDERLMNLSGEVPPGFSRFTSVIEVVSEEPEVRQPARERFKFYKDRGYEIQTLDLAGKA
ncbi:MAG: DNA polymerase III subunit chi [Rhodocyclales bacterium]|nr:DNA polymerase III subunit chi [Rhodocyclales bacterium]